MKKEAQARLKINKLLENAGWRLLDSPEGRANVFVEVYSKGKKLKLNELGDNFEEVEKGFVDYLLYDKNGYPIAVLEAKSEEKEPLFGKEQARKYAIQQNCRYIILSNGNQHYLWDTKFGDPEVIIEFPAQGGFEQRRMFEPDLGELKKYDISKSIIGKVKNPDYDERPEYLNENTRSAFLAERKIKELRPYQVKAVQSIKDAILAGKKRFLIEMATGTGKTLMSAAIIRMLFQTNNANRILFLVDRIELEDQAYKAFNEYLTPDMITVIYKQNKSDWQKANIVVTTVQSLLFNNRFMKEFNPMDFDFVISDEAHRSIGGNARAVFEYFIGYKLGLTATPKNYLKSVNVEELSVEDPRQLEKRILLDTYKTFGCEIGQPTFSYDLNQGVEEGYLLHPFVIDARTDITTELLAKEGYNVAWKNDEGEEVEDVFLHKDFEKKFYSHETNVMMCRTFLENGFSDPISSEFGKSIVFAVSQKHAARIANIFNHLASQLYPGKYNSDFAMQVTSVIPEAQDYTKQFSHDINKLRGNCNFLDWYKTSKTRICVTVGMMTTGYDCTDILNIGLMRPIFSVTDFIQIKGRGTRKHNFTEQITDNDKKLKLLGTVKERFSLFDFFANCEYFENEFDYDKVLKVPKPGSSNEPLVDPEYSEAATTPSNDGYIYNGADALKTLVKEQIGRNGMKPDRMLYQKTADIIKQDPRINEQMEKGYREWIGEWIRNNVFDKPNDYINLDKIRRELNVDRRITIQEFVEFIYGLIPYIKKKDELIADEFNKFILNNKPDDPQSIKILEYFFRSYLLDSKLREIIETRNFQELYVYEPFPVSMFKSIPEKFRMLVPEYIKNYVVINKFMN